MRPIFVALILSLATAAVANAAPQQTPSNCFVSTSWQGWSAPGDGDVIYLSVGFNEIYRLELTKGSHVQKSGDNFLVNRVRGSGWICSPLDLDLTLSDHNGFREPLIARTLRKLTDAEVAAIPRKDLP